jgi:hypothetical protein
MSILKGAAGDNEGACQLCMHVGVHNTVAVAGLLTSHVCGHVQHGGCSGFADLVGMMWWLQQGCRLGVHNVVAMAGLLTSHACGHVQCGGCGRVADFACVRMYVTQQDC